MPRVKLSSVASTFFRIGIASFSLAALGEARNWMTQKRKWFTDEEYLQGLGLAQLMPGAPSVNLSSYLGFRLRGLPGAATATIAFIIPCFLLMLLLSYLYLKYGEVPAVSGLFRGLGALVVGLVFNTVLNLWKTGVKTVFNWIMAITGFVLVFWLKMGAIKILLIAGGASFFMMIPTHGFPGISSRTGTWKRLFVKKDISFDNLKDADNRTTPIKTDPPADKSCEKSDQNDKLDASSPENSDNFISACSAVPLPLHWRHTATLFFWFSIVLLTDLFLVGLQPDLMQMGNRFLRIGALVFGSGYAMLPFIQDTAVNQFTWLTDKQFAVALALSLITPGPVTIIGVFIGYKVAGVMGAMAGIFNMYFPAWAMTTIIAAPYAKAGQIVFVKQVIGGIVAAFIGTLAVVLIKLAASTLTDVPAVAMALSAFVVQRFIKTDTVWIVLAGAIISVVLL